MTTISARIPQVDWSQGFDRHWNGGNLAVTHAFNALSLLFPQAECFFIEVAREVVCGLDSTLNPELERAVKGFIAQESTHTQQHNQYNAILKTQGFENVVHNFVQRLQERSHRDFSSLTKLAIVCGYEHYTAILGNYILTNPQVLGSAEPDMALIWGWYSAEVTVKGDGGIII
jgi:predicted metal-dependent hydrolase